VRSLAGEELALFAIQLLSCANLTRDTFCATGNPKPICCNISGTDGVDSDTEGVHSG
jgi:hypothetical protein